MRRASKVDSNHARILRVFQQAGCEVLDLHTVGDGCPDVLIYKRGVPSPGRAVGFWLVEIKSARGKFTPQQQAFHRRWPVQVVRSEAEALALVGR